MREVASSILVLPHFFLFFSFFFSFFLAHSPLAPGVDQPDRDGHRWGGHQGGSAAAAEKKSKKGRAPHRLVMSWEERTNAGTQGGAKSFPGGAVDPLVITARPAHPLTR